MLALWLGDFPDSSCRLAGKSLTEKSSSHFPAVPWQDKTLNPSHRIVLEAKEQVANGFPGRWRPHSCSREPFALLAAGTTPRRLPSALECWRNGGQGFQNSNRHPQNKSHVLCRQTGRAPGWLASSRRRAPTFRRRVPQSRGAGLSPWIHPTFSFKTRKGAGCGDVSARKALLLEPERLRREGADRSERDCSGGDRSLRLQVNPTQPRPPASGSGGRLSAITPDVRQTRSSGVRKLSMRSGAWPPRPGTCRAQTGHACPQSPVPGQEDTPRPWVAHRPGEGQL